jgi:hypothetical protein
MKRITLAALVAVTAALAVAATALAATVVVTPSNTQGWSTGSTTADASVTYTTTGSAPGGGIGALRLTTSAANSSRAQYLHDASVALGAVGDLSYWTKQNSASFAEGAPSYQIVACLGGVSGTTCNGFTTLVYEPYWNGAVVNGTWQQWDVDAGLLWSSRNYSSGSCIVAAAPGGPPAYTVSGLAAACPNAVVIGFGVNVGTFNPSYDVETDLVTFNGTTYDFEPYQVAASRDACKDGGWQTLARADGSSFKNQGDCIQYVNTGK